MVLVGETIMNRSNQQKRRRNVTTVRCFPFYRSSYGAAGMRTAVEWRVEKQDVRQVTGRKFIMDVIPLDFSVGAGNVVK